VAVTRQSHLKLVRAAASHEARDSRGPLTDAEIAIEVEKRAERTRCAFRFAWHLGQARLAERRIRDIVEGTP
jgi:ornithine carbamoyltransferase